MKVHKATLLSDRSRTTAGYASNRVIWMRIGQRKFRISIPSSGTTDRLGHYRLLVIREECPTKDKAYGASVFIAPQRYYSYMHANIALDEVVQRILKEGAFWETVND